MEPCREDTSNYAAITNKSDVQQRDRDTPLLGLAALEVDASQFLLLSEHREKNVNTILIEYLPE